MFINSKDIIEFKIYMYRLSNFDKIYELMILI